MPAPIVSSPTRASRSGTRKLVQASGRTSRQRYTAISIRYRSESSENSATLSRVAHGLRRLTQWLIPGGKPLRRYAHAVRDHDPPIAQRATVTSKATLDKSARFKTPIVTEIVANARFWRAEEYHQHFADRNPERYDEYRRGCGRDERLHELWGDAAAPFVPRS